MQENKITKIKENSKKLLSRDWFVKQTLKNAGTAYFLSKLNNFGQEYPKLHSMAAQGYYNAAQFVADTKEYKEEFFKNHRILNAYRRNFHKQADKVGVMLQNGAEKVQTKVGELRQDMDNYKLFQTHICDPGALPGLIVPRGVNSFLKSNKFFRAATILGSTYVMKSAFSQLGFQSSLMKRANTQKSQIKKERKKGKGHLISGNNDRNDKAGQSENNRKDMIKLTGNNEIKGLIASGDESKQALESNKHTGRDSLFKYYLGLNNFRSFTLLSYNAALQRQSEEIADKEKFMNSVAKGFDTAQIQSAGKKGGITMLSAAQTTNDVTAARQFDSLSEEKKLKLIQENKSKGGNNEGMADYTLFQNTRSLTSALNPNLIKTHLNFMGNSQKLLNNTIKFLKKI